MAKAQVKKAKKAVKKTGGPFLNAAFFCESTIEDKQDGAMTAVRIIDQINIFLPPSTPPDVPSEENRIPVHVSGLLSLKSGDSPGDHDVRLVMHSPSGKFEEVFRRTVPLSEPPHGGANIRLNLTVALKNGGLFWMDVFLDDKLVTRVPIQILIQRVETPPSQSVDGGNKNGT